MSHTYLGRCARVRVDPAKVIETDHDKEVMAICKVAREEDRVLGGVQKGNHVDVHGCHHHCNASYDQ